MTQTAWNRYVRKKIHIDQRRTVLPPLFQEHCSGLYTETDKVVLWSQARALGDSPRTAWYAALEAGGELAARGVSPAGVSLQVMFPLCASEEMLSDTAEAAEDICRRMGAELTVLQGGADQAVNRILAVAAAAGQAQGDDVTGVMKPGEEILLCGFVGLAGTLCLLDEAEDELAGRFVPGFLEQARRLEDQLVMPGQIASLCRERTGEGRPLISCVQQIGAGGILAALWDMAERSGTGMEVRLEAMTLKQETVEICEYFQINPYQMTSAGSYLIATGHGEAVIRMLRKQGLKADRIGRAKEGNARVITGRDETRYLDRPAPDSLTLWQEGRPFRTAADQS